MPPHCDSLDGPVVTAANNALEHEDIKLILPYVPKSAEQEVLDCYDMVMQARKHGGAARDAAYQLFYETTVRLHRAGEGEPFTGIKPAGMDHGPVVGLAEHAIRDESPAKVIDFLKAMVEDEVNKRFAEVMDKKHQPGLDNTDTMREYVSAMLGFQVYSHKVYKQAKKGLSELHAHDRC